jgi:GGDEF domain-containing protein
MGPKLAAEVDPLTGLPNHAKLLERLDDALQRRALDRPSSLPCLTSIAWRMARSAQKN